MDRRLTVNIVSEAEKITLVSGMRSCVAGRNKQDMEKELGDITKTEDGAIADFESLVAAKEKEIAAATEAIEMKLEKNGEMAVKIVNLKNDLEDAQESLGEDQKFLAELKKGCATAGADYDSRVKGRAEELVAVQETIKILNDDDASADRQL